MNLVKVEQTETRMSQVLIQKRGVITKLSRSNFDQLRWHKECNESGDIDFDSETP
jgi:hypothetical protein